MALQGIGGVIPIFALYDQDAPEEENGGKIYFYDALGAHFENVNFATTGSGSIWIRGVLTLPLSVRRDILKGDGSAASNHHYLTTLGYCQ